MSLGGRLKRSAKWAIRTACRGLHIPSTVLGAPRGWQASTKEWVQRHPGATYRELLPAGTMRRTLPRALDEETRAFFRPHLEVPTPPAFVATIPRARVWGWDGVVISPDDLVLLDVGVTFKKDPADHQALWLVKYPPLRRVRGQVAIVSAVAVDNYFHWLYDALPRLELLERAGVQPDCLCVRQEKPFQRESWECLQRAAEHLVPTCRELHLEAEELVVASYPGRSGEVPEWVCHFLRKKFLTLAAPPPRRRFYITRAGAGYRLVENEAGVCAALTARGFEIVEPGLLNFREQVELFAAAETIVAPHGAALSNLVFCPPATVVVEIFSPAYVNPLYWGVACHQQLRYAALLGRGPREPQAHDVGRHIEVDIPALLRLLDEMAAA